MLRDVWNRAAAREGTGVGDRHLGTLLLVDGMLHNGGASLAVDSCEPAEIAAAADAARYFGLDDLAVVIEGIPAADDEDDFNDAFFEAGRDGEAINDAFEARYAAAPGDFDPV